MSDTLKACYEARLEKETKAKKQTPRHRGAGGRMSDVDKEVERLYRTLDTCIFEPARTPLYYELRAEIERLVRERDEALEFGRAAAQQSTNNARRAERAEREAAENRALLKKWRAWYVTGAHTESPPPGLVHDTDAAMKDSQ